MASKQMGHRVWELRKEAGLTQEQLTATMRESGLQGWKHPSTLSRIETGDRSLLLEEAVVLAGILEITVDQLAERVGR